MKFEKVDTAKQFLGVYDRVLEVMDQKKVKKTSKQYKDQVKLRDQLIADNPGVES
jgi:hypothetical protein